MLEHHGLAHHRLVDLHAQDGEQRSTREIGVAKGVFGDAVDVGVDDARGVVGALDVAPRPVDEFSQAREHGPGHWFAPAPGGPACRSVPSRWASGAATFTATDRARAFHVRENPRVLRSAALTRVHDERSLAQGHSRESTREHPHVVTVVNGKGTQIHVTR